MSKPLATTSSGQFVTKSAFAALAVEDLESEEEIVHEEHAQPSSDEYVLPLFTNTYVPIVHK